MPGMVSVQCEGGSPFNAAMAGAPSRQNYAAPIFWKQADCSNKRGRLKVFSPKSEVEHSGTWQGRGAALSPSRAERAEQIVQGPLCAATFVPSLTLRSATETAQRAIPANIRVRVERISALQPGGIFTAPAAGKRRLHWWQANSPQRSRW